MRIGVLVGKTEDGKFLYLGEPGDIVALNEEQRKLTENGGKLKLGKKTVTLIKTWLADAGSRPLKAKKCVDNAKAKADDE